MMGREAFSITAPLATKRAGKLVGKLTSSGSLPILRLAHIYISSLPFLPPNAWIAWRRLSNLEFPEPICPDMSTCPTTK